MASSAEYDAKPTQHSNDNGNIPVVAHELRVVGSVNADLSPGGQLLVAGGPGAAADLDVAL